MRYKFIVWSPYRVDEMCSIESVERAVNERVAEMTNASLEATFVMIGMDSIESRLTLLTCCLFTRCRFGIVDI